MDQFNSRKDIPEKFRWNLNLVYPDFKSWDEDFARIDGVTAEMERFRGNIAASAVVLKNAFDIQSRIDLLIEKLYSFAHHLSDEDTRDSGNLGRMGKIASKAAEVSARLSWVDPELLDTPVETLSSYQKDPLLKDYSRRLEFLVRSKPHQRSAEVEEILSLVSEPLGTAHKAFNLLENADMRFSSIQDAKGKEIEINHSSYSTCLESDDRDVRKKAYESYMGGFSQYQNTFAATLEGHVKKQIFYSKVRNFKGAMEASLFSDSIPNSVYNGLIDTVHNNLPLLHRWVEMKKQILKLDQMELYDLFVPMVKPAKVELPYEEAMQKVIEGMKPLGADYVQNLKKAFDQRWIDVYYTTGKRSGAYSGGMYLTHPYILLNHKDNLNSAFTLAHELGHSLHTYYSNSNQPYPKAGYPIFLAEVASTTNEMLLHFHLFDEAKTPEMKAYLLDHLFTQFRGTLYRQVQFAEFERDIHALAEKGEPLTAEVLSNHYHELNAKYYGPKMSMHPLSRFEWSRIPHFYYNFYVYKYSTSFAAAQYFARKIYDGDSTIREKYLNFLKSGGSEDPLDTMIRAGMDLRDSKPIEAAFQVFGNALDEFSKII